MYQEIIIDEWTKIEDLELEFSNEIYRGQADKNWEISTSISRALGAKEDDPNNSEFWFLREFKKGAAHYISNLPEPDDYIGWLALMQHYGTPTRLIDFTHSFYVACYFALIGSKVDAAVWSIDFSVLHDIGHSAFSIRRGSLRDEWEDDVYSATNGFLKNILSSATKASTYSENPTKAGIVAIEPIQYNLRLRAQQGLFVLPLDITSSFLENVNEACSNTEPVFKKYILKKELRFTILGHLKHMNITSETLFPGMEGFARSIAHRRLDV